MSAGILRNWYLSKIAKSMNPVEYLFAMQDFIYYDFKVRHHDMKEQIFKFFDKYK